MSTIVDREGNAPPHTGAPVIGHPSSSPWRVGDRRRDAIEVTYPLTGMQQGMLFETIDVPGSGVHVMQLVVSLPEAVEAWALEEAWQGVVERHAVLRSAFSWGEGDEAARVVYRRGDLSLQEVDLRFLGEKGQREAAERFLEEDRATGFDLGRPPLMRLCLMRLDEERYELVWTFHHIVLDGRSYPLLLEEVFEAYEAVRAGEEPAPASRRPYEDFAAWIARQSPSDSEPFWREALRGFEAPTALPWGGSAQGDTRGDTRPRRGHRDVFLTEAETRALSEATARQGISTAALVQGAWALLLARHGGEEEVVFGATRAGRPHELPGSRTMVGLFINTLPVRVRVPADEAVGTWLLRLQEQQKGFRDHEQTPLWRVKQWSEVPASGPLFESVVMYEKYELEEALRALGGAWARRSVRLLERPGGALLLGAYSGATRLRLQLWWDGARLSQDAAEGLLGQLRTVMLGMARDLDQPLWRVPLLTEAERHRIVVEWNRTEVEYPETTLHELFEEQALRTPDAVAVVFEGEQLSYRELDERANQLAHHLQSLGVGPDVLVGICVDRSLEMVVGLFGVLKAGGAYVPLDPGYPAERLAFMLEDASVSVLLTHERLAGSLPRAQAHVIRLDSDGGDWKELPRSRPAMAATAESLAYVIFTSGSTGRPKGAMNTHRGIVNLVRAFLRRDLFTAGIRASAWTSLAFDVSVYEIFGPLVAGGELWIVPERLREDGLAFLDWLLESRIQSAYLPPFLLGDWAARLASAGARCAMRRMLVGVEPIQESRLQDLMRSVPGLRVVNAYGPTEAAVCSTAYVVPVATTGERNAPIGRPLMNTAAYVLDAHGQPVPVGVAGELCIGGMQVCRGYLNRPELTREKLVPDPFSERPGARLYRTGDLCRYLPDGNLEFLGRLDHQVKLRGFRIELGEIEAVLGQHKGVKQCIVLAREDRPGDKALVAYVVADPTPAVSELRAYLGQKLPDYMVPSSFVFLPSLPLTPNGKVDRKALPAPAAESALVQPGAAPRSPLEELVAEAFTQVLGLAAVGIHDDFFHLGGHSLKATQLVSRLRTLAGAELPVRAVFDTPTVAGLAKRIQSAAAHGVVPALPSLQPADPALPAVPSAAQRRLWFLDQLEPGSSAYNMPTALRLRGRLNTTALEKAVVELLRRHQALRARFVTDPHDELQVHISPLESCALRRTAPEVMESEAALLHELTRQATEEAKTPFDLAQGPLFRCRLVPLAEDEHLLLTTVHHIVFDGWSDGVLMRELSVLYGAFCRGEASPLPEPALQYSDYARWQQGWLQGDVLQGQLAWWKEQLAGAPRLLELPTDYPRPAVQRHRGGLVQSRWSRELRDGLMGLSRREGATLFMTLLAGLKVLLARLSGQEDVVVGTPIAGRNHQGVEDLVGFFLSTLVLRTDLSGDPSFFELLGRVKEVSLSAYAHQDVPFEKLVEELRPDRSLSHTPLFQVMLNVLNHQKHDLHLEGLDLSPARRADDAITSKFDVTLYVEDQQEGLAISLVYNRDLFSSERMKELGDQLQRLMEQAVEQPTRRIGEYSLLTPGACAVLPDPRRLLLPRWEGSVVARLGERAGRMPDRECIVDAHGRWTYGELESASDRLARALRLHGIGAGDLVAIHGHRSGGLVVALLAAWKAGAAFLILDPAHPAERLLSCLKQAAPRAWLDVCAGRPAPAVDAFAAGLPCRLDVPTTPAECAWPGLDAELPEIDADAMAYLAFTSGSTGEPKGIVGTHRPLSHFLAWHAGTFEMGDRDRFCLLSGLSHDPLLRDMLTPIWVGGTLCIPDEQTMAHLAGLAAWLGERAVTIVHLTPALGQVLAEAPFGVRLEKLRYAFFGGDALTTQDVVRLRALAPSAKVVNFYGATETPQAIAYHVVERGTEIAAVSGRLPVGRGIEGVDLLVLTASGQQVGLGEIGEIAVRTPYLAAGYWKDAEQTAARFIANPWSGADGDRIYRTGDLGRCDRTGRVEMVGRRGHQVKVRGFRVELGEIELVLGSCAGVKQCVVLAREDRPGDKALLAYVVADRALAVSELRADLERKLPDYMVPSAFVFLPVLPLTPNGKVDRNALPAPNARTEHEEGYVGPRTPDERALVTIWEELLHASPIGVHDRFFSLGGHSLLAVKLGARVRDTLGVTIPIAALFELATVSKQADAIVAARSRLGDASEASSLRIIPVPGQWHDPFPLTELQQSYWIGQSGVSTWNNTSAISYREFDALDLDIQRANTAIRRLVARHPMLRTVIHPDGSQQVLESVPAFALDVVDLRGSPAEDVGAASDAARDSILAGGKRLDRWPLVGVIVLRLDGNVYRLHIGVPLVLADRRSFIIVVRELRQIYRDPGVALPQLAITFRDHVAATLAAKTSEPRLRAERHWMARLPSLPSGPELPLARSRTWGVPDGLTSWSGSMDPDSWRRLKQQCTQERLTPSGAMCAVFTEVVAAFSKSAHFLISVLHSCRPPAHPQSDSVVGNFGALLLLEIDRQPEETFAGRARRLQKQLWDELEDGQFSGIQVLRELAKSRGVGPSAVPVVFSSLFGTDGEPDELAVVRPIRRILQTPHVLIDFQVGESAGRLFYNWDMFASLLPDGLPDAIFSTCEALLRRLAAGLGWQETSPAVLPASQLAARIEANGTEAPTRDVLLHELFAEQACKNPRAPAVIDEHGTLSYDVVSRRANQVANRLRALGARPNVLVAVVMEKGWEQIVAVLGILGSGAAYLPIDPELPTERVRHLLEHGEVRIALTQPWIDEKITWPEGVTRVVVTERALSSWPETPPARVQSASDLAYVIYTSGSTGLPKGVMIDHRGAVNTVLDINARFLVGPTDRVLSLSSLSFDLSVYDIFGVLAAGGTVVLPSPRHVREPAHWDRLVTSAKVTMWNSVPALMQLYVEYVEQFAFPTRHRWRLGLLSGDWIPLSLPERIQAAVPGAAVVSLGGATEASIWSIFHSIEGVDPGWQSIPYGRPLANQRFHVLDDVLRPRPAWVPGELFIGGIGLALGYWRDPERTAERFIRHPETGERLYRTGDLGRYAPDGSIEFLGRADFQVKVQGYRIELGEIEAQLEQHPSVGAAAVAAHGDLRGEKRLVAYVVGSGAAVSVDEIRVFLATRLPRYMVPSIIVPLEQMPLTANGKVDRKALPLPGEVLAARERTYVAPRNQTERALVHLWEEVLGVSSVGVHDNFFESGGHSFAVVRLMARIQKQFGQEMPPSTLLQAPTVEQLAEVVDGSAVDRAWSPLVPIRPEGKKRPFFCVHPIGGNVFCYRELSQRLGDERPFHGLQARGLEQGQVPLAGLTEMAEMYVDAVRKVQPHGPYLLSGWSMGGLVALEMAHVLRLQGEDVALVALLDTLLPEPSSSPDEATTLSSFLRDLASSSGHRLALPSEHLRALKPEERMDVAFEKARAAGVLTEDVDRPRLQRLLQVFEAHSRGMAAHTLAPISAPTFLLRAEQREAPGGATAWPPSVECQTVPGDHYTILTAPHVDVLAARLRSRLDPMD